MKVIKGYEGHYHACQDGRIWAEPSNKRPKGAYLRSWKNGVRNYQVVMLYKDGKPKHYLVHRLVAEYFIPNPKKLPEVNHINGNVTDNRAANLEWVTSKENKAHAWKNGLYSHSGVKHHLSTLNEEQVRAIRVDTRQYKEIAEEYKICNMTVSNIKRRKTWKHI